MALYERLKYLYDIHACYGAYFGKLHQRRIFMFSVVVFFLQENALKLLA